MKKIALMVLVAFGFMVTTNAQDLTSKNGTPILPEAGDFAVGIDASPIFNFFGNFVKINSGAAFNDPAAFNFIDGNNYIYGKYFVDAETAYRGRIRLGFGSVSDKEYIQQDGQADPLVTVEDKQKLGAKNIFLGAGLEKHRGKGRLRGIYGAEAMIMLAGTSEKYEYGNGFTTTSTSPGTTNFGTNIVGLSRVTEAKSGSTIGFGVGAFVGVEFFILPKISVGGEFNWGLMIQSTGDGEQTSETWDGANNTVKTTTTATGGGGEFGFDTDNFGGNIYMMFHF